MSHQCVYCGQIHPEYKDISRHHAEEHSGERYDPVWYLLD